MVRPEQNNRSYQAPVDNGQIQGVFLILPAARQSRGKKYLLETENRNYIFVLQFLSVLLDGLHEDLNRVTDKPYVELKDSDGRPDVMVAAEAWENHSLRNRSIIVDLFHGQHKSKVTCTVCGHESVRCDPFFTLSLPLPMERCVSLEVVLILQDGSTPVKYGLTLDMEDKCSVIPPKLARLCSVPPSNLVLVDIVQSQV